MTVDPSLLAGLQLVADVEPARLVPVARRLTERQLPADCTLIRQGQPATSFALVIEGELDVTRTTGGADEEHLAVIGPGSIVGELALLRRRTRVATVSTRGPARVLVGDRDALVALLHLPLVVERLRSLVSRRLAEDAHPVAVNGRDGRAVSLRPLRPDDRDALQAGIDAMSDESLYRRFFTGGRPSEQIVEALLDVDYLDHFAWVVADGDDPEPTHGLGVARYHRLADDPAVAEAAFAVVDDQQGRGLGTLLCGALAVAARAAAVERLRAEVLSDNRAMRAVLDKAGAHWERLEQGVVETFIAVDDAVALLDAADVERLERAVREIVTASGLALTRRVD